MAIKVSLCSIAPGWILLLFVFGVVAGVVVGRCGLEFRRAGVHHFIDGYNPKTFPQSAKFHFGDTCKIRNRSVGKPGALRLAQQTNDQRILGGGWEPWHW